MTEISKRPCRGPIVHAFKYVYIDPHVHTCTYMHAAYSGNIERHIHTFMHDGQVHVYV